MAARSQDHMLVAALKSHPPLINLNCKNIYVLPDLIGKLTSLKSLLLKNNNLSDLPRTVSNLKKIEVINLGNNNFEKLPAVFISGSSITHLHLFNNQIATLDPEVLCGLSSLKFLNLNSNKINEIPEEINRLSYLEVLSLNDNQITDLPVEICHLSRLKEFDINNNFLKKLPDKIAFLKNLTKLRARKNRLESVPERRQWYITVSTSNALEILFGPLAVTGKGLLQCKKLALLDVAGNFIKTFPSEILKLSLHELYCEENNLLQHLPVHSIQEREVLNLKELTARFILLALKDSTSNIKEKIKHYPEIEKQMQMSSGCVVCGAPFLNIWLECVQFVDSKKTLGTKNNAGLIPVSGLLCSYKCFNEKEHDFFGIALAD